ncbi:MAG: hypothetical protein JNM33_13190 [Rubrivivax sp.]|nr:hypothetical protein [Rubrivivax sp.]
MESSQLLQQALQEARQASSQGHAEQAVFHASNAAGLALDLGDELGHAEAQSLLVLHLFSLGRFADALQHGHLALQAWQRLEQHDRVCETQLRLALSLSELGIHLRASALARAAQMLAQQHGLDSHAHQALALLGGLCGRAGDVDDGELLLLQALSRASETQDQATRTTVLNTLLALLLEGVEQARAAGDGARLAALAQRLRRHAGLAWAHCTQEPNLFRRTVLRGNVAAALAVCGQTQEALGLQRACAQEAAEAGFRVFEMRSRSRLATLLLDAGDSDAAVAEVDRMESLVRGESNAGAELELLTLRARVAEMAGQMEAARDLRAQAEARRQAHAQLQAAIRRQVEAEAAAVLDLLAPGP